ncbi:MAG: hypothetical protein FJ290_29620 [Planctomycetes bacterium]|nr:hypothetical protein [Planctomycetota bacterium]
MEKRALSDRELERIVKGFANHRRIQIMRLLEERPDLSLGQVCASLRIGLKTGCEHVRRLAIPGLVAKRDHGRSVRICLTPLARDVLTFLRKLE